MKETHGIIHRGIYIDLARGLSLANAMDEGVHGVHVYLKYTEKSFKGSNVLLIVCDFCFVSFVVDYPIKIAVSVRIIAM